MVEIVSKYSAYRLKNVLELYLEDENFEEKFEKYIDEASNKALANKNYKPLPSLSGDSGYDKGALRIALQEIVFLHEVCKMTQTVVLSARDMNNLIVLGFDRNQILECRV